MQVKVVAKAGANGRLFGAVTNKEISDALAKQHGMNIEKNKIVLSEPIKSYGAFDVKCKFGYEISGVIHVLVCEG
jgi:large subunit ribosomal protein L9